MKQEIGSSWKVMERNNWCINMSSDMKVIGKMMGSVWNSDWKSDGHR
jgi:hypothetical protein